MTNKTTANNSSVNDYLISITDEKQRNFCQEVLKICHDISKEEPVMWGPAIIGFGTCHYRYESGREGDQPRLSFSARKGKLAIYLLGGTKTYESILANLGPHKTAQVCLYVNKYQEIDLAVLRQALTASYEYTLKAYPNKS